MTSVSLHAMYEAKVYGTIALHEAASKRENVLFLSSSSARTLKGGMTVGAYCAANEFVEQFAHYQRLASTVKPYCFSFSMWDETGMSEGSMIKGMLKERGYLPIPKRAGIQTMLACMMTEAPLIYIGLDQAKQEIQEMIQGRLKQSRSYMSFSKPIKQRLLKKGCISPFIRVYSLVSLVNIPSIYILKNTGKKQRMGCRTKCISMN